MGRRCVKYLLFEEFVNKGLGSSLGDYHETQNYEQIKEIERKHDLGEFFIYSGAYWIEHFVATPQDLRPEPIDLVALCGKKTRRLNNWKYISDILQTGGCSFHLYYWLDDPLAVMAWLDPKPTALGPIAKIAREDPAKFCTDLWDKASFCLIESGMDARG